MPRHTPLSERLAYQSGWGREGCATIAADEKISADRARQAIGHLRTGGSYLTLKSLQPSHANRMEDTPVNAPKIKQAAGPPTALAA